MLDRTVRKGDLYELPTGVRIPGRIVSEASMVAALHGLGWTCKRQKGKVDDVHTGKVANDSSP
jgi:hypothetical protein